MKERFEGVPGRSLLVHSIQAQRLVDLNEQLAEEIADQAELLELDPEKEIITQGDDARDVYLVLTGSFRVLVNGKQVAARGPNDSVGEMAAINPLQLRSATVIADETSVVAKLTSSQLEELGSRYPEMYRAIARDLGRRLEQRNRLVTKYRARSRVFVISSTEALPIARAIQSGLRHDPFLVTVWENGVFFASDYTLEDLEKILDESDFGIAVATPDDFTISRGTTTASPRDNVLLELGLFIGRLGRRRTILMIPHQSEVKIPTDLIGLKPVKYKWESAKDGSAMIAPACNELRDYFNDLGPNN